MLKSKLTILMAPVLVMVVLAGVVLAQEPAQSSALVGEGTAVIWDDVALSDAITFSMTGVTSPVPGTSYEGWVKMGSVEKSTGVMAIAANGSINHSASMGENLILNYDHVVITIEPVPDNDPKPSGIVAFSASIDSEPIKHIRHLLADWPSGSGVGILTNLQTQLNVAITHANLAKNSDTIADVHKHIEHVVNIIEGENGDNYGDLDGNGAVEDFGDGIGVLNHAANRTHAGFASVGLPEASDVATHGALVDEYVMNISDWATFARDQAIKALGTTQVSLAKIFVGPGADSVITLLGSALNGSDIEGPGASQAYVEAQRMATYTFQVVPPTPTPTPVPPTPTPGPTATPFPTPVPPTPTPTPVPDEVAPPTSVGDPTIPLLAQIGLIVSLAILAGASTLVLRGRRSRIRT